MKLLQGKSIRSTPSIFGTAQACIYTIEYQKRGLPHAHTLLSLDATYRQFLTADYIDNTIILAELATPQYLTPKGNSRLSL
jgi:Helitron helicase-like domain at N-terminus